MIDRIEDRPHPTELLPWYLNGTLDLKEKSGVDRHLAECNVCRQELGFLKLLKQEVATPIDIPSPELMYRQFRRATAPARTKSVTRFAPMFALAASLLVVVQAGIIVWLTRGEPVYQPAGASINGVTYEVRFDDRADQARIRALLYSLNLRIVDGPSAMGLYTLRFDGSASDAAVLEQKLAAHPELIDYLKPH